MMGGLAVLIVRCRQDVIDTKLTNKEGCFYWPICDQVLRGITEVESPEERCPCCGAGMSLCHCRTRGFSPPLLWSSPTSLYYPPSPGGRELERGGTHPHPNPLPSRKRINITDLFDNQKA